MVSRTRRARGSDPAPLRAAAATLTSSTVSSPDNGHCSGREMKRDGAACEPGPDRESAAAVEDQRVRVGEEEEEEEKDVKSILILRSGAPRASLHRSSTEERSHSVTETSGTRDHSNVTKYIYSERPAGTFILESSLFMKLSSLASTENYLLHHVHI